MKTVKIGALKNQLSSYLRDVQRGEEVIVCDREKPVARIIPIRDPAATVSDDAEFDYEKYRAGLIAQGRMHPPIDPTPIDWDAFDALPKPTVSAEASAEAIRWAKGNR